MNISLRSAALLFVALHFTGTPDIFAQGSLTPPGSPAPTMKSLDQIEPRTPISALPFTISTGGSYYLTKSLSVTSGNAITITVDNVTLDLSGFTISSSASPASGNAITLSGGRKNVRITNGNISGTITFNGTSFTGAGFSQGIVGSSADPTATTVSFVNVSGCATTGIFLQLGAAATLVDACNVWDVGGYGIAATNVTNSTASNCGLNAITGNTVANSRGDCVANGNGIYASVATNCYATSLSNTGLYATTATGCYGQNFLGANSAANGIYVENATGCYGVSSLGSGIKAITATNCEGFTSGNTSDSAGLHALTAQNCHGSSTSTSGTARGLWADDIAIGCVGENAAQNESAYAIKAVVAFACYGAPAAAVTYFCGPSSYYPP